jgi:hypothetical protein
MDSLEAKRINLYYELEEFDFDSKKLIHAILNQDSDKEAKELD